MKVTLTFEAESLADLGRQLMATVGEIQSGSSTVADEEPAPPPAKPATRKKRAAKKSTPATPKPANGDDTPPTIDLPTLQATIRECLSADKKDEAKEVLAGYGAAKASEVPEESFAECHEALQALINA